MDFPFKDNNLLKTLFIRSITILLLLISVWILFAILYASFSAFTAYHFTFADFCKYTNMIWNCGHGAPFKVLTDMSYLSTHLSFTLALLGPVFLIFHHPFTLSVIQLFFAIGGAIILWTIGRKDHLPDIITATVIFAFIANPYTQSVLLSEFHGVAIYFLLIPWLYYCLRFRKSFVWLPIVLVCGVREDAAFILIPILLFFAVKDRWRIGYLWAILSLIYGIFACTVLFEWINHASLVSRRASVTPVKLWARFTRAPLANHVNPLLRSLLPTMAVLPYGWLAVPVFLLVPVLQAFFSPYLPQYTLSFHYPAAIQAFLAIAIMHGLSVTWHKVSTTGRQYISGIQAGFLIIITVLLYLFFGYLSGGRQYNKYYKSPRLYGVATLNAVKHLPPEGVLLCHRRMAAMCAARSDIITWQLFDSERYRPDVIFLKLNELRGGATKELETYLTNQTFGVTFFDGENIILERGKSGTIPAKVVLRARDNWSNTIPLAFTSGDDKKDILGKEFYIVRFWHGSKIAKPTLVYGKAVELPPGNYIADFYLKTNGGSPDNSGIISLHPLGKKETINSVPIKLIPDNKIHKQRVPFTINKTIKVEPRITGGSAELWLAKVVFEKKEQ